MKVKTNTLETIKAAFKTAKEKLSNIIRYKDNSSYIYTDTLYNTQSNFIVFISFSEDYLSDAVEIIEAANNSFGDIHVKYNHTEYDEHSDDKDEEGKYIVISHKKHYLLMSGASEDYAELYTRIANLGNSILKAISKEIVNKRAPSAFDDLIKDHVLNIADFKDDCPEYDEYIATGGRCHYDDISLIMKRLPNSFSTIDLLELVNCYDDVFEATSAYDMIVNAYKYRCENHKSLIETIFSKFFTELINGEVTDEKIFMNIIGPKYAYDYDDIGSFGDNTDAEIDDIFKEQYDRFSAISDPTDNIHYESIDEVIEEIDNTTIEDTSVDIYSDSSMTKKGGK